MTVARDVPSGVSGGTAAYGAAAASNPLRLAVDLQAIFEQSYPRFSDTEYARRHAGIARAMAAADADHALIVTAQNVGNATRWMTNWPGTAEALLLFRPGEPMVMFVEYYNHLPLARQISRETEVRWGEEQGVARTIEELARRGAKRVGVVGPLSGTRWKALEAKFELVSLDADYVRLRMLKSDEEIAWLRIGAALSDAGMAALVGGARPGMTEHELAGMIERAFIGHGGTHVIHFIGATPMADPDVYVPRQFTSRRRIAAGDFVFCELSAAWWDYAGQVLRGFSVEAEPTALYRPSCHCGRGVRFHHQSDPPRRAAAKPHRCIPRHRGQRLHHLRRSRARLRRRLFPADHRFEESSGRPGSGIAAAGEHVHGGATQCDHARHEGRRPVRRTGPRHQDRL